MLAKTIFLSAGHGGNDRGAISPDGTYREADLALRLRDAITEQLTSRGLVVINDGRPGENRPLSAAIALARPVDGPKVEIHFNSVLSRKATGTEALAKPDQRILAQRLAYATAEALKLPLRGNQGFKLDTSGQHKRLGFCDISGVVLEVCFISNPDDMRAFIANEAALVKNIADALERAARG
jgi:N-acetylmuramoyl-L-alanine amidase